MGSIVKRPGKKGPRYIGKMKGLDGRWTSYALTGCSTKDQAKIMLADAERNVRMGLEPFPKPVATRQRIGELLTTWSETLTNKSAKADRWRIEKHVRPRWGRDYVDGVTVQTVLTWLDEMRVAADLAPQTQLHNLQTLSRFFSWAVERGHVGVNPVVMVPRGRRPKVEVARDQAWIEDDDTVLRIVEALPTPIDLMWWLGNRCGCRLGEICGLRLSDLAWIAEGTIRLRYSYAGPLKEGKATKWTVAPADAVDMLGPWLKARRADGAKDEDLVFPYQAPKPQNKRSSAEWRDWSGYHPHYIQDVWKETAMPIASGLTWYRSTRHSFASRNLAEGASLEEVSSALGHSSPVVTMKRYIHLVRKTFSETMRRPVATKP